MIYGPNSDILTRALTEIRAVDVGGAVQPELFKLALDVENEILDLWNAERGKAHGDQFLSFVMQTAHQPTTIGPAGADWVTGQPPVSIEGIQVLLTGTPVAYVQLNKRDAAWWQGLSSPGQTAPYPSDFYYDPIWSPATAAPFGSVYLWPKPTQAYNVQVWCRILLAQLTAQVQVSMPPGYRRALILTVAKAVASNIPKPWSPLQDEQLRIAMSKIEANNTVVPMIRTQDSGMPRSHSGSGLPNFFWPTGALR